MTRNQTRQSVEQTDQPIRATRVISQSVLPVVAISQYIKQRIQMNPPDREDASKAGLPEDPKGLRPRPKQ